MRFTALGKKQRLMPPAAARADEADDLNIVDHEANIYNVYRPEIVRLAVALKPYFPATVYQPGVQFLEEANIASDHRCLIRYYPSRSL
jgi:hypothetical protein